jgi:hypothetical protein
MPPRFADVAYRCSWDLFFDAIDDLPSDHDPGLEVLIGISVEFVNSFETSSALDIEALQDREKIVRRSNHSCAPARE